MAKTGISVSREGTATESAEKLEYLLISRDIPADKKNVPTAIATMTTHINHMDFIKSSAEEKELG